VLNTSVNTSLLPSPSVSIQSSLNCKFTADCATERILKNQSIFEMATTRKLGGLLFWTTLYIFEQNYTLYREHILMLAYSVMDVGITFVTPGGYVSKTQHHWVTRLRTMLLHMSMYVAGTVSLSKHTISLSISLSSSSSSQRSSLLTNQLISSAKTSFRKQLP